MHVQASFDGTLYRKLQLEVIQEISAWLLQSQLNEQDYAMAQAVSLLQYVLQSLVLKVQLWLSFHRVLLDDQSPEDCNLLNELKGFRAL